MRRKSLAFIEAPRGSDQVRSCARRLLLQRRVAPKIGEQQDTFRARSAIGASYCWTCWTLEREWARLPSSASIRREAGMDESGELNRLGRE